MRILAIDPGPEVSGWVWYDTESKFPTRFGIGDRDCIICFINIHSNMDYSLVIEKVGTQQGNTVGATIFDTCRNIGRFEQAFDNDKQVNYELTRHDVIIQLYGFMRKRQADGSWFKVRDKHINALLVERYGGQDKAIGGVKCPKCKGKGWFGAGRPVCPACNGNKWLHAPGPLHGIKTHIYDALALAIAYTEIYIKLLEEWK